MKNQNLKLKTCLEIFKEYDEELYAYLRNFTEKSLNMGEVSKYARFLKNKNKGLTSEK